MFGDIYHKKRVLLTGHTGFKGSWLAEWLLALGAEVTGFSDCVRPEPDLFSSLGLAHRLRHVLGDVRDRSAVARVVAECEPDFVFHLAAQPLVRRSYQEPVETMAVNVLGTAHVLDALRSVHQPVVAVMVTTDKCYENRNWVHSYREEDALGGHDPYSASKGCAELVISSYRRSFFQRPAAHGGTRVAVASARAGNVIGGGDWAEDRIVPDAIRALQKNQSIIVRNPRATRPWQHVLEPLGGYLWLGAMLRAEVDGQIGTGGFPALRSPDQLCSAYNFGPLLEANRSVEDLIAEVLKHWPGGWIDGSDPRAPHEAALLNLAIDKAWHELQWQPVWDFARAIEFTTAWYRAVTHDGAAVAALTRGQIERYVRDARLRDLRWSA